MSRVSERRRQLILASGAALLSAPVPASQRMLTPSQLLGPFYPVTPPLHKDNDLTQVDGRNGRAAGDITDFYGNVLDVNGRPMAGMRVEIWQCDANGRYRHPRDRQNVAEGPDFQGFGHTFTDDEGRYRFRTIRPVPYPGRTPHVHAAVFPEGSRPFVTQIYVAGEALNLRDGLFMRVPEALLTASDAEAAADQLPMPRQGPAHALALSRPGEFLAWAGMPPTYPAPIVRIWQRGAMNGGQMRKAPRHNCAARWRWNTASLLFLIRP